MIQHDLFAASEPPKPAESHDPALIEAVRARLRATLDLVTHATAMPWSDLTKVIREDNQFRFAKNLLPPEEGAALWAAFDAHMDRLYAIMNEGKDFDDLGDLPAPPAA